MIQVILLQYVQRLGIVFPTGFVYWMYSFLSDPWTERLPIESFSAPPYMAICAVFNPTEATF